MSSNTKVLVVDCNRNGLGVLRALHQAGIETLAVDHDPRAPGLASRAADATALVADPSLDPARFLTEIGAVCREHAANHQLFVLPMNDKYVLQLGQHWSAFADCATPLFEIDPAVLRQCLDKTEMYAAAAAADVTHPETTVDPAQAAEVSGPYPVIVKPGNRNTPELAGAGVFKARVCQNPTELDAAIRFLQERRCSFVVQTFIPGGDDQLYTCGLSAWQGEVVAAFTGRKLRQFPPQIGQCAYGELTRTPEIVAAASRLVSHLNFTGIAQVEFKAWQGRFYLMEINPRSWSWNSLGLTAGVNLPAALVAAAVGQPRHEQQSQFKGTWSYLPVDILHNVIRTRNLSLPRAIWQGLRADQHAFFSWRDPAPAVQSLRGLFSAARHRLRARKETQGSTGLADA